MDVERAKQLIHEHAGPLAKALGIPHWELTFQFDLTDDEDDDERFSSHALVDILPEYNKAVIRFNLAEIHTDEKLLECLRHELYHVVLAPLDLFRDSVGDMLTDPVQAKVTERLWRHAIEKTVINLGRMYVGLREAAPPCSHVVSAPVQPYSMPDG